MDLEIGVKKLPVRNWGSTWTIMGLSKYKCKHFDWEYN